MHLTPSPARKTLQWQDIHTIVFDFDGVFTDNNVYLNSQGEEFVRCSRSDGLGVDFLRLFAEKNMWPVDFYILTKDKSEVAKARAAKMRMNAYLDVHCKSEFISRRFCGKVSQSGLCDWQGVVYLGNDLNDYMSMKLSGFSICPEDSHPLILSIADLVMPQRGGSGFVRASIEAIINLDALSHSFFTQTT